MRSAHAVCRDASGAQCRTAPPAVLTIRIFVGARKLRRSEARQADAQQANADGAFVHEHRIGCINDGREYHPRTELLRMRTESGACIIARPEQRLHDGLATLIAAFYLASLRVRRGNSTDPSRAHSTISEAPVQREFFHEDSCRPQTSRQL